MLDILKRKDRQNFNYTEKVAFLSDETYKYFTEKFKEKISNNVDLHYEIYAKQATKKEIFKVISENRVDECFNKMVKALFEKQDYKTLYRYGVLN